MRIKLDKNHYLNSDPYCYWITVEVKSDRSKGKTPKRDAYERRCSGYTATFSDAVDSFIEKKIKAAQIEDFKALVKEINDLKKQIKKWKSCVDRGELNDIKI